jgi:transcriptional regulator with GAF, ATPase, and Fis domain
MTLHDQVKRKAAEYMRRRLIELAEKHDWNFSHAAKEAGMDVANFRRLVRRFAIKRPE